MEEKTSIKSYGPMNPSERKEYNERIVNFYGDIFSEILERSKNHSLNLLARAENTRDVDLYHKGTIRAIEAFEKLETMARNELAADAINKQQ